QGTFNDCNNDPTDGCETSQACLCIPGTTVTCYGGPPGTLGVGQCEAGTKTCNANGIGYSACTGQILPSLEVCGDNIDNDCNNLVDASGDPDGDGFELCDGSDILDCCEDIFCSANPELINPAAFDVDGDNIDNDCDGVTDNGVLVCDGGITAQPGDLNDYARAMGLCNFTTESSGAWGVTNVEISRADGSGNPIDGQYAIQDGFGTNGTNREGNRLVVLSTGYAADNFDDANPSFVPLQDGTQHGSSSPPPNDFASIDTAPGCPDSDISDVNDSVLLTVTLRAPINALSFSADIFFLSTEYPEWVCSPFNDYFVTLVDEQALGTPSVPGNPADKNIAIYNDGTNDFDIGVNILKVAPGLFTQCEDSLLGDVQDQPGPAGWACVGMGPDQYTGCTDTSLLTGTGYDLTTDTGFDCNYVGPHGGGTGWLTMTGNLVPGEINRIRFLIWDTADGYLDSSVLLDNWTWSASPTTPGVTPG
ncbi:MAG: choice-of-anchor L domain-containing protein, partial [Nannocystaceae bacterium]